ncbi:ribosomal RNA processing protein 1 homolog [Teleopsis dalmanni]|uniref:ribosomal RNA processing protein 1 homolog n=1 Tax=Teleopsis dalmanni TaxID=139649 RepID=UPI0018CDEC97|nr:ribosomal RNA processing protein 1 homolog [Teleopsis dalmanni]
MVSMNFVKKARKLSDPDIAVDQNADEESKEVSIIAKEIRIVKALACNDLNKRCRQLKILRNWMQLRHGGSVAFGEEDFLRIWKGLYYMFWLSDKPLVQEDLAERFGRLLNCFSDDVGSSINFFGAFLKTMCQQWFGIDQWRLDKYLMLVRRMLRYMLQVINNAGWSEDKIQIFNDHISLTVLSEHATTTGLTMHLMDIFFEELAKVSAGNIEAPMVGAFAKPFIKFMGTQRDSKLVSHCRKQVFYHLLYQSNLGREYTEKYNAWRDMGFPTTKIDDLEPVNQDCVDDDNEESMDHDEDSTDKHLDPRAGKVDIFMPELPLDAKILITELEKYVCKEDINNKRRKMLKNLLEVFRQYENGIFALGVKTIPRFLLNVDKPTIEDKVDQLENMENEVFGTGRKLKQLNKRKRRKLLKSLNLDNVDENNFDDVIEKAIPKKSTKVIKKKAQLTMMNNWIEEDIDVDISAKKEKSKKNTERKIVKQKNSKKSKSEASEDEPANKIRKTQSSDGVCDLQPIVDSDKPISPAVAQSKKSVNTKTISQSKPLITAKTVSQDVDQNKKIKETKILSKTTQEETNSPSISKTNKEKSISEWDKPLKKGEVDYFIPSRKIQVKNANSSLVRNPLAKNSGTSTPKQLNKTSSLSTPSSGSAKRVKIALKHNTSQNPSEYLKQIRNSPNLPFDADKKPGKGLLKPNLMPSPINPFYKKKLGLNWLNDTL